MDAQPRGCCSGAGDMRLDQPTQQDQVFWTELRDLCEKHNRQGLEMINAAAMLLQMAGAAVCTMQVSGILDDKEETSEFIGRNVAVGQESVAKMLGVELIGGSES